MDLSLPDLVKAFNELSRSAESSFGFADNHWQFEVHHISLQSDGDVLYIMHPITFYSHAEGPAQILILPLLTTRAKVIVPLLLQAFVSGLTTGVLKSSGARPPDDPRSWGTSDTQLAKAIEKQLTAVGVVEEFCVVKTGNAERESIERRIWVEILALMTNSGIKK